MSFSTFRMNFIGYLLKTYKKITNNKKTNTPIDTVPFTRILVVSNKLLGDFLFCTPAIRALKEKYPNAKILVVLSHGNRGLVGRSPFIDDVIYMGNSTFDIFKALKVIRGFKPEISIIFHSRTPYDLIISVLSRCQYILKHYFNNDVKKLFYLCDDYILNVRRPPVINHLSLVEKLGCDVNNKKMFFPATVSPRDKNNSNFRVGYQLGASKPNRYLPVEMLQELTEGLIQQHPSCEFHLFGAPSETALGDAFISTIKPELNNNIINHIGKTTLIQLASAVNNVDVLITPDTGTLHIATALEVRTISLFVCRRDNGCEPQQDPQLHHVIYASDYNGLAFDRTQPKPLKYIPCSVIFDNIINIINNRGSKNPPQYVHTEGDF